MFAFVTDDLIDIFEIFELHLRAVLRQGKGGTRCETRTVCTTAVGPVEKKISALETEAILGYFPS